MVNHIVVHIHMQNLKEIYYSSNLNPIPNPDLLFLSASVVRRRLLKSELSWEAIAREAVRPATVFGLPAFGIMDGRGCRIPDWVGTCIAMADPP